MNSLTPDAEVEHPVGLPASTQRKRKGQRKYKKQMERAELAFYYEELASASSKYAGNYFEPISEDRGFSPRCEAKMTVPKNRHQREYLNALNNASKKIVVCTGPAGTGKTLFATECGVRQFLTGAAEKLVFTRPSVSVDEDLGFLPGSLEDKMAPWIRPIYDILYGFLSPTEVSKFLEEKSIEIAPLGYMRGRTFKNAWIVADEMQNSTVSQMKMLLTRLGENSRLVVTGDLDQFDRPDSINGLEDFLSKFKGKKSDSISSFEFDRTDIQREEVVKEVLDIYAAYEMPAAYRIECVTDESESDPESVSEPETVDNIVL
jgi:phosphate starvation-inducible PhoH-like protein